VSRVFCQSILDLFGDLFTGGFQSIFGENLVKGCFPQLGEAPPAVLRLI